METLEETKREIRKELQKALTGFQIMLYILLLMWAIAGIYPQLHIYLIGIDIIAIIYTLRLMTKIKEANENEQRRNIERSIQRIR